MSGPQPQPADPTNDGAFRYSFLALFDEEDAHHLHQAGVVLSQAAIAGEPEYDPVDRFQAACRDARALRVYLQEVRDLAREDGDPRAAAVVERADYWQRQLEDVVAGIEADLRKLPAPKPDQDLPARIDEGQEVEEAEARPEPEDAPEGGDPPPSMADLHRMADRCSWIRQALRDARGVETALQAIPRNGPDPDLHGSLLRHASDLGTELELLLDEEGCPAREGER